MSGSAHLALLSDTAMDNSFTGDLRGGPGICGGWHLSGVCMYVFLVLGTARGAAGRVFPAMLRARESGVLRTPESGLRSPTPGVQESLQTAAAVVAVCRGGEARAGGRRAGLQRMHRGARPQCCARVYRRVGQGSWCVLWLECSSAVAGCQFSVIFTGAVDAR